MTGPRRSSRARSAVIERVGEGVLRRQDCRRRQSLPIARRASGGRSCAPRSVAWSMLGGIASDRAVDAEHRRREDLLVLVAALSTMRVRTDGARCCRPSPSRRRRPGRDAAGRPAHMGRCRSGPGLWLPGSLRIAAKLSPALCANPKFGQLTWLNRTPWPHSSCSTTRQSQARADRVGVIAEIGEREARYSRCRSRLPSRRNGH